MLQARGGREARPRLVVTGEAAVVGAERGRPRSSGGIGATYSSQASGKMRVGAALVEPVDLLLAEEEDPPEHELGHALGVRLGVGQRQRAPPRAAEDLPPVDPEVRAERLDVGDEVPGRVVLERSVRRALAAAPLIEEHDAVAHWDRRSAAALAPVPRQGRRGGRRPACPAGSRSPRSRARGRGRRGGAPLRYGSRAG